MAMAQIAPVFRYSPQVTGIATDTSTMQALKLVFGKPKIRTAVKKIAKPVA